jgi:integrase
LRYCDNEIIHPRVLSEDRKARGKFNQPSKGRCITQERQTRWSPTKANTKGETMIKMQPLSDRELLAVLGAAKKESARDHALLLICYCHAMRANECGKLLVSDISVKDQTIRIARSKGSLLTVEKLSPHSNHLLDQRKTIEKLAARQT